MKNTTIALLLIALTLPPAQLLAAAQSDNMPACMGGAHRHAALLDSNKDGFVSRDEAATAPRLLQHFDGLDEDRDGRLSLAELRRGRPHPGPQLADTNKDGYVSRQEALEFRPLLQRFDQLDSNQDGMLSQDELRSGRPCHRGAMGAQGR